MKQKENPNLLLPIFATNFLNMNLIELKKFLDEKAEFYNKPEFVETDPISIPHRFTKKEDIEISAFLSSTIAWGNRKMIINNATKLMGLMENTPHDFVINHGEEDLKRFQKFVHRTFNHEDTMYFMVSLKEIYKNQGGLEGVFTRGFSGDGTAYNSISGFYHQFFSLEHLTRSQKHISNPEKGSAAKRMNMFLRWMVRDDGNGVDFGIWKNIPMSKLMIPLDVHTARLGRKFELLKRSSNDWKAVEEYTNSLRALCPEDPIKYDFALFGMGVFENIK